MRIKYQGIDHVGVAVADFEEALKTYRDVLGFEVSKIEELPDRGLKVAFVETGSSRIELLAPMHDNSEVSKFLKNRGCGMHHLCVGVSDIEKALAQLKSQGAQLINEQPQIGAGGCKVAFVHPKGAEGVLLELSEHTNESEAP